MRFTNRNVSRGFAAGILVAVVSILLAGFLFLNRQYVADQISVWQYSPNDAITSFVTRSGMNDQGKFYFYASQPSLEDAKQFNELCGDAEKGSAILGCYNGRNIYIYNVMDKRLTGIRTVTAAHEMLHAVFVRLSEDEKGRIGTLLEAEYDKIKNDQELASRLEGYERTEPGERLNELHSIIGTEIRDISPELEAHYQRYFSDRSKTVALFEGYSSVFDSLQQQADELSAQLETLRNSLNQKIDTYNQAVLQLNQDIEAFNTRAESGGFSSQGEFASERAVLVARSNQLANDRQSIENDRIRYEELRQQLLAVAAQSKDLYESIDSSLAPAPDI